MSWKERRTLRRIALARLAEPFSAKALIRWRLAHVRTAA
jgi:hypothetical protein